MLIPKGLSEIKFYEYNPKSYFTKPYELSGRVIWRDCIEEMRYIIEDNPLFFIYPHYFSNGTTSFLYSSGFEVREVLPIL